MSEKEFLNTINRLIAAEREKVDKAREANDQNTKDFIRATQEYSAARKRNASKEELELLENARKAVENDGHEKYTAMIEITDKARKNIETLRRYVSLPLYLRVQNMTETEIRSLQTTRLQKRFPSIFEDLENLPKEIEGIKAEITELEEKLRELEKGDKELNKAEIENVKKALADKNNLLLEKQTNLETLTENKNKEFSKTPEEVKNEIISSKMNESDREIITNLLASISFIDKQVFSETKIDADFLEDRDKFAQLENLIHENWNIRGDYYARKVDWPKESPVLQDFVDGYYPDKASSTLDKLKTQYELRILEFNELFGKTDIENFSTRINFYDYAEDLYAYAERYRDDIENGIYASKFIGYYRTKQYYNDELRRLKMNSITSYLNRKKISAIENMIQDFDKKMFQSAVRLALGRLSTIGLDLDDYDFIDSPEGFKEFKENMLPKEIEKTRNRFAIAREQIQKRDQIEQEKANEFNEAKKKRVEESDKKVEALAGPGFTKIMSHYRSDYYGPVTFNYEEFLRDSKTASFLSDLDRQAQEIAAAKEAELNGTPVL